ncbi:MAG: tRNA 2-thiocytidine biosynthesis protein TtcA [Clostridiales bacterium]|nr:tRNA 2-thiocytidine biosynthesis protein TtcA [Clostridiales bacterium]
MKEFDEFYRQAEHSITKTYRKRIWNPFIEGLKRYEMIDANDKTAVCISGGKDSMLLAVLMRMLQRYSEVPFELEYICMDPGYTPENRKKIEENAEKLNIPVKFFCKDIFKVVDKTEKSPCYLCARMRRGSLYEYAQSLGCNKIALGHHFSDVIETTLMGMLYGGQIQGMLPKLKSTSFEGMQLIRPLYCVHEKDIIAWKNLNDLDFLDCACSVTRRAGDDAASSKRAEIKQLIRELKKTNPNVEKSIFNSIHNVNTDTLIEYKANGETHSFLEKF